MNKEKIQPFTIIGLAIRTTNENGQAMKDIPVLWSRFFSQNIAERIPNKIDGEIYCVYTDYEKDHTRPYTTLLGCRVKDLSSIPEGLTGKSISGGAYARFTAKGKIQEGIVAQEWVKIWNADIQRVYTEDFEVYGAKADNSEHAEIDIFVAVK